MSARPLPRISHDSRPFWDACAAGELRVQRCGACGVRQFPNRARCTGCGSRDLDWQVVPPSGEVHSFTVVHRAPTAAFKAHVPYVIALVDVVDRARMMMNVADCDPQTVHIGMRVHIDFERRVDGGEEAWLPVARPEPQA